MTRKRTKQPRETTDTAPSDGPSPEAAGDLPAGAVRAGSDERLPRRGGFDRPSSRHPDAYESAAIQRVGDILRDSAQASPPLDAEILTDVPFLEETYGETYLYLVPRNEETVFALWETGPGGAGVPEGRRPVLRVSQVTNIEYDGTNANVAFEIDDNLSWTGEYWVRVMPGQDYIAELGYREPGEAAFRVVARSNSVRVPRAAPETADHYDAWASVESDPNEVEVEVSESAWRFNQYLYWKRRTHAAPQEKGYWSLVLHQHLPFVRHPEYNVSLEEQWFFEAVVSVYTQLLNMLWRLERDKVDFRLTVSLTPPLLSMMRDPLLQVRAARHIHNCIAFAERERDNSHGQPYHDTVEQTLHRFWIAREVFDAYDGDLTKGYRDFQNMGKLEVITCPATHMLLPLFLHKPEMIRGQVRTAVDQYTEVFGRPPRGMWLPENAYSPGLDELLAAEGIRWFLVNDVSLLQGDTRCYYGTGRPVVSPAGCAAFGIDQETRTQIWSREGGYPGHPNYKEWYRDLGYDADWEYLPEYFRTADVRRNTGLKYYRITGKETPLDEKAYYDVAWAEAIIHEQSGQFVCHRGAQANHFLQENGVKGCVVSAYDAELFGHWWEEGPAWIESVFRKLCHDQAEVRPVTPSEFLAEEPRHQRLQPGAGSWGKKDDFSTWVDGRAYQPNVWIWRHYYRLADHLADLAATHGEAKDPLLRRALNQAARELCLAVASDWAFLIETGQAVRYSELQIVHHLARTRELLRQVRAGTVEERTLATLEAADTIFPFEQMDVRVFARREA